MPGRLDVAEGLNPLAGVRWCEFPARGDQEPGYSIIITTIVITILVIAISITITVFTIIFIVLIFIAIFTIHGGMPSSGFTITFIIGFGMVDTR